MQLTPELRQKLLAFQKNEITEVQIYRRLADRLGSPENRAVLLRIADDELGHYQALREVTGQEMAPDRWQVFKYTLIARLFGFTFAVKLMERGEESAQANYEKVLGDVEGAEKLLHDENVHEEKLLAMLDEELLRYAGSIVLGLNDALVELTGALAGLTLALQNTRLIALTGLIMGIAAALSMAASEYLATRSEGGGRSPVRAALYTGSAYVGTVFLLILPYLIFANYFVCLAITLGVATLIIAVFNYYISVAKDEPFRQRFLEMAGLSFGVAGFSFLLGFLIRTFLGVEV